MSIAWFVIFILLWTGFLAGASSLITAGRVNARFAQLVWRGAALLSALPVVVIGVASLVPQTLPSALPDIPYVEPAAGAVSAASTSLQTAVSGPQWAWTAPTLFAVLAAGWALRFGAALLAQARLQRLKSRSVAYWRTIDAFPLTELGLERVPNVRLIPGGSPFIAGFASRAIYVPEGLEAPEDLRQIGIHECVHLKRGDLITRPLERLVADIFWFSPFAWMMRRELDFWREAVCDEIASELSGDRIGYARTLAQAARISAPVRALPVAAFILPRKRSLPMRLNRLFEHRPARSRPVMALGASLVALALTPFALAEGQKDAVAAADGKEDGEASFDFAVLLSPDAGVSSRYGERTHPVTKKPVFHNGTDIKAPMGTPVHTPGCGTVVLSASKKGYGETVEIAFGDGSKMRFAQLSERLVEVGDEVNAGTVIGKVGMSGKYATGPHLHLEHWQPQLDAESGETELKPLDPQKSAGLVLYAAG
ncbi:M23/M56 family metallopeptidase [Henriciella sp.]|uniref:M23/M56 family metallopeptidase n=1 Tax=Henriciella sp. TaxID=1968823 RepID=UPI00260577D8|nr:M23/M56 family metallopeptidase [Henriciella sp.]